VEVDTVSDGRCAKRATGLFEKDALTGFDLGKGGKGVAGEAAFDCFDPGKNQIKILSLKDGNMFMHRNDFKANNQPINNAGCPKARGGFNPRARGLKSQGFIRRPLRLKYAISLTIDMNALGRHWALT
jgi:hypothetical protein